MKIKSPLEENGSDGHPKDNEAFREACRTVLERVKEDAKDARAFLEKLSKSMREYPEPKAEMTPAGNTLWEIGQHAYFALEDIEAGHPWIHCLHGPLWGFDGKDGDNRVCPVNGEPDDVCISCRMVDKRNREKEVFHGLKKTK